MTYFFVGGSQRSGTTLLQSILCAAQSASPLLPEAMYFRSMISNYQLGKVILNTKLRDYFSDLNELRTFSASWAKAFLDHTQKRYAPIEHLVLKEPHLTMLFPEIYELIEDVKFLIIVRDPRDTIASMIQVGERLAKQGQHDIFCQMFTARNINQLANHYKSFYAPCYYYKSDDFQQKLLYVKYEFLVSDPLPNLERIKLFTGLSLPNIKPTEECQGSAIDFSLPIQQNNPWYSELYGKGISSARLNIYHQILKPEEIRQIEEQCADVFQVFGYKFGGDYPN